MGRGACSYSNNVCSTKTTKTMSVGRPVFMSSLHTTTYLVPVHFTFQNAECLHVHLEFCFWRANFMHNYLFYL